MRFRSLCLPGRLVAAALLLGPAAPASALDLNSATAAQLRELKGLGPRSAELIVHERDRAGPYRSLEDLSDRVRGIGARKAASLAEAGLTVGKPSAGQPAGAKPATSAKAPAPARRP
ncbi:ComEA family DNA-binding protein [Bordetella holmesii]|nr:helix-hairpin-helix domain-containing protein [Bordetella holmesii]UEB19603.1 helix-hairpin-helix domain-containing protein [Bordetella holmesii]SUV92754.1 comEA protein [Bordetella holmesii]